MAQIIRKGVLDRSPVIIRAYFKVFHYVVYLLSFDLILKYSSDISKDLHFASIGSTNNYDFILFYFILFF